jgi:hypothetical protein
MNNELIAGEIETLFDSRKSRTLKITGLGKTFRFNGFSEDSLPYGFLLGSVEGMRSFDFTEADVVRLVSENGALTVTLNGGLVEIFPSNSFVQILN